MTRCHGLLAKLAGYVWDVLSAVEPELTARTGNVETSEWLGFPPFVARADRMGDPVVAACAAALLGLAGAAKGQAALDLLFLDSVTKAVPSLFDGIAARMSEIGAKP